MKGEDIMAKRYGDRYWEKEAPVEIRTRQLILRYYQQAGKLQVAHYFTDRDGREVVTRTVTLDQEDLQLHPQARDLLVGVMEEWAP